VNENYRDNVRIEHMIDACRRIIRLVDVSRTDYDESDEKQLALERLFEIVGEAAARVSDDFKSANPQVPWRQATAMRNFVIHDYAAVSPDITWDTAQNDIPTLLAALLELQPEA